MLAFLLQLVIFEGALYDGVEFIKLGVSSARLTITDIVVTCVYVYWFFLLLSGRLQARVFSENKTLCVFILTLLIPILIGFNEGNLWQTILREARAPYYYGLSFVVASHVKDENALKKIMNTMIAVGMIFLIWGYLVYIFKIPVSTNLKHTWLKSGLTSRYFGYHSAQLLIVFCALLLVNYFFNYYHRASQKFKAAAMILLFVVGQLLTLIRGFFLGMVSGLVISLLIQRARIKWSVIAIGIFLTMVVSMLVLTASSEMKGQLLAIPIVERYTSIIDPSVTTKLSAESGLGRYNAIKIVERKTTLFGEGYGEKTKIKYEELIDPVQSLMSHSGPSWMLYRTGYIGTFVLSLCMILFLLQGYISFKKSKAGKFACAAYGGACASLVAIYVASVGGNIMFGSERFSPLIAVVVGLVLSNINESKNNKQSLAVDLNQPNLKSTNYN
jgi:hypothetical protein